MTQALGDRVQIATVTQVDESCSPFRNKLGIILICSSFATLIRIGVLITNKIVSSRAHGLPSSLSEFSIISHLIKLKDIKYIWYSFLFYFVMI